MKSIIELNRISFYYENSENKIINNITLNVPSGDFLLITGSTGCGKSTLLKTINGLIPHESGGQLSGEVIIAGSNTKLHTIASLSKLVGTVFQSPEDQIFSTSVYDEVAFILENSGVAPEEINERVLETLKLVGLGEFTRRSVHALSGGQKQRLVLAAIIVAKPQILLLDEPISQLDPQGAADLLDIVVKLNRQGITIIMVEHRLHEVMPICKHIAIMSEGNLVWHSSKEVAFKNPEVFFKYGLRVPTTIEICSKLGLQAVDASVDTAVKCIRNNFFIPALFKSKPINIANDSEIIAEVEALSFQYSKHTKIIQNLNLTIKKGEFVAIMGKNGSGKSTLLQLISGLLKAAKGKIELFGNISKTINPDVGLVLQNPDLMLFNISVEKELEFALKQRDKGRQTEANFMSIMGLAGLEKRFPLSLSRGQRFRVAIAAALATMPKLLLLDEPTTGQDIASIHEVMLLLKEYINGGGSIIFCTHDTEIVATYASRLIIMKDGQIIANGAPQEIFNQQEILESASIKMPQVVEVSQELFQNCYLTVEEVVTHVRQNNLGGTTS